MSFLLHDLKREPGTVVTCLAVIADLLKFGFGISLDTWALSVIKSGFFYTDLGRTDLSGLSPRFWACYSPTGTALY